MLHAVEIISRERGISSTEALKRIIQDFILKNVSAYGSVVLIGGCALIRGYNSPRFSEDVDFTGIEMDFLKIPLQRACKEIEVFLRGRVNMIPHSNKSWRIIFAPADSRNNISVHVDTQPYRAHLRKASIVNVPGLVPFMIQVMELNEIIAEKVIALGTRNYLNGRDLFDIYYHVKDCDLKEVFALFMQKLSEREIRQQGFIERTISRLKRDNLSRAKDEWIKYLPANLLEGNRTILFETITKECFNLLHKLDNMENKV